MGELQSSRNTINVVNLRWVTWAGYVAHIEEMVKTYKILVENLKRGDPNVDTRIILKWILKK
jgi:hypothetical protein